MIITNPKFIENFYKKYGHTMGICREPRSIEFFERILIACTKDIEKGEIICLDVDRNGYYYFIFEYLGNKKFRCQKYNKNK